MKLHWFWGIFLVHCSCFAQFVDNFSDGDFSQSPAWLGSDNSFRIESQRLHLDHTGGGMAYLSTSSSVLGEGHWEFEVELLFNPSSRNFCRVYVVSDQPELNDQLKGYYIQIGGSNDDISLYRQDISSHFRLIDGPDGMTDTSVVKMSIKLTRDLYGTWELYTRNLPGSGFRSIGTARDQTSLYPQYPHFFGLFCQFTTTRSKGFYFDNIMVTGRPQKDTLPPDIGSVRVLDKNRLLVHFSEPLPWPMLNQFIVKGIGSPSQLVPRGYAAWELVFATPFVHGVSYLLEATSIEDWSKNLVSTTVPFQFWQLGTPQPFDVIITEIMADPDPALQLPQEYLEIHNRSDSAFNLLDWTLSDAARGVKFPNHVLTPGSYLLICRQDYQQEFSDSLNILGLESWPTLNNSNDQVILSDSTGRIMHFIEYDLNWYRSELKRHGGWSLEMIDVNYPCSGSSNWAASSSPLGGTPGNVNSIATDNPDFTPPLITGTLALDKQLIKISFDQALGYNSGFQPIISFEPRLAVDSFYLDSTVKPEMFIKLKDELKPEVIYGIRIEGVADCNGNLDIDRGMSALVGLPQAPDSSDLLINEVLFNPRPLGVRFVEVYNHSSKAINLKNWRLAGQQSGVLTDFKFISTVDHMIYPGEYRAFTTNIQRLLGHYPNAGKPALFEIGDLPTLGDNEGCIALISAQGMVIDFFSYHKDMHHPLLRDLQGVSLERVSPDLPTKDVHNWFSGAELNGYATPGSKNSQFVSDSLTTEFKVEPRLISPLSSSLPAYTRIIYRLNRSGSTGSVYVFNQQGYRVRTLVNNSLLSNKGAFQWDGTDANGLPVPMGYYIILFRISGPDSNSRTYRESVAVAVGL